jgi:hypothetical protein
MFWPSFAAFLGSRHALVADRNLRRVIGPEVCSTIGFDRAGA